MGRLLTFGDDRSAGADIAWRWICAHNWSGWSLEVVQVESPLDSTPDSPLGLEEVHPWVPEDPRNPPPHAGFGSVEHLTAHHDPRLVLGDRPDSSLIVIGTRGKGILKALHIGSTAEWLLQSPGTPLLLVRSPEPATKVLACVDGSGHADRAVAALADLPWIRGVHVTVVGVDEGRNDIGDHVDDAVRLLSERGAVAVGEVKPIDPLALAIQPRSDLLAAIKALHPDLVVLGTHGRTGLPRVWLGSVAGAIAHQAPCSVLVARDLPATIDE